MQATETQPQTSLQLLVQYMQARRNALSAVMAKTLNPDRVLKIAIAAASRNPRLLQCSPESIYSCVHTASQMGFEAGGPLGEAYLVPFKNGKTGRYDCTLILGYQGYLTLAMRSGHVQTVYAEAVRQGDEFECELGLHRDLKHKRKAGFDQTGKNIIAAYAVAHFTNGGFQFVVMPRDEIEAIRSRARSGKDEYSPWNTSFEEMAKKTAIRRLQKYIPKSIEMAEAIEQDDGADSVETIDAAAFQVEVAAPGNGAPAGQPATENLKNRIRQLDNTPKESVPMPEQQPEPVKRGRKKKADPATEETAAPAPVQDVPGQLDLLEDAEAQPEAKEDTDDKPKEQEYEMPIGVESLVSIGKGMVRVNTTDNDVLYITEKEKPLFATAKNNGNKVNVVYVVRNDRWIVQQAEEIVVAAKG